MCYSLARFADGRLHLPLVDSKGWLVIAAVPGQHCKTWLDLCPDFCLSDSVVVHWLCFGQRSQFLAYSDPDFLSFTDVVAEHSPCCALHLPYFY